MDLKLCNGAEKPGAALYRCIMECLRERDTIEAQARSVKAEIDRKIDARIAALKA